MRFIYPYSLVVILTRTEAIVWLPPVPGKDMKKYKY